MFQITIMRPDWFEWASMNTDLHEEQIVEMEISREIDSWKSYAIVSN